MASKAKLPRCEDIDEILLKLANNIEKQKSSVTGRVSLHLELYECRVIQRLAALGKAEIIRATGDVEGYSTLTAAAKLLHKEIESKTTLAAIRKRVYDMAIKSGKYITSDGKILVKRNDLSLLYNFTQARARENSRVTPESEEYYEVIFADTKGQRKTITDKFLSQQYGLSPQRIAEYKYFMKMKRREIKNCYKRRIKKDL